MFFICLIIVVVILLRFVYIVSVLVVVGKGGYGGSGTGFNKIYLAKRHKEDDATLNPLNQVEADREKLIKVGHIKCIVCAGVGRKGAKIGSAITKKIVYSEKIESSADKRLWSGTRKNENKVRVIELRTRIKKGKQKQRTADLEFAEQEKPMWQYW